MPREITTWARIIAALAIVAELLGTPWGAAMTTLAAAGAAAGVWFADWHNVAYWLASLATFTGVLWTVVGIVWLGTRSASQTVKTARDYSYGLTWEGLIAHYDPNSENEALGFGVQLRNFTQWPIRYVIEEFDVRIDNRALPRVKKKHLTAIMPRGAGRVSMHVPFRKRDIKDLEGEKKDGTVEFLIDYGHPEHPPERRLRMLLGVQLDSASQPGKIGIGANIIEESDAALETEA